MRLDALISVRIFVVIHGLADGIGDNPHVQGVEEVPLDGIGRRVNTRCRTGATDLQPGLRLPGYRSARPVSPTRRVRRVASCVAPIASIRCNRNRAIAEALILLK